MKKEKILLVDDDPDIIEIIRYNLEKEGFKVYDANNGKEAITIAIDKNPDLVILDVMMPEMDGMETCFRMREIPQLSNTLITFLTARGEDYSKIAGFDAGADDYITKPIQPRVLVSKIKAILRRKPSDNLNSMDNQYQDIEINKENHTVKKDDKIFTLPKKEFKLLCLLLQQPDKVYSREAIMNKVWGEDVVVGERTVDVHIRKLREKLGEDAIKTISGVGYKFKG